MSCRPLPSTRPPDTARVSNWIVAGAAADVGEHELVDVDRRVRQIRLALVEPGELEEVVDERAESLVLGEQAGRELGPVGVIRVAQRDLEVGAHRRDGAAQLV